ncbi:MAG: MFS transporter [Gemmatimonadetes bacterium]|nr:MFS transporter [Gemmatimonadota bacterium]
MGCNFRAREDVKTDRPPLSGEEVPPTEPPERWAALVVLSIACLLGMTPWFSASAVLPRLVEIWDLSPSQGAWLTIAVQLGFVAGALASALLTLADVIPPRRLFLLGCLGAAAANALLLVAGGATTAIPLRFATGAFLAAVYPPAMKSMATWFRAGRGTAIGVLVGALTIGSATPHLVNGLGGEDWRVVVVTTSILTLLGGVVAEVAGSEGPFPFPRARFDPRMAGRVMADRGVRLASFGYFGHMWELYAMWSWFLVFSGDVLAFHEVADAGRRAAFATFAVIAVGAGGCWLGGRWGDRWGRTRTTILAMSVSGACALTIGAMVSFPPLLVLAIGLVWGVSVVADSAQFSTAVTEVADQRYVGTALTLQTAIGFTLTVATIWLVPLVRETVGWWGAFAILAPGPALGVLAMERLRRSPEATRIAGGRG